MEVAAPQKFSVNQFTKAILQHRKAICIYSFLFVMAAIAIGAISLVNAGSGFFFWLIRVFQLVAFLGLGWLNTFLLYKYLPVLNRFSFAGGLVYPLLLSLVIGIVLMLFNAFTKNTDVTIAYMGSCAFLLPFTIAQSWLFFKNIPKKVSISTYNAKIDNHQPPVALPRYRKVQISIAKKYADNSEEVFPVTVPEDMPFSRFFNGFILGQNNNPQSAIEYMDEHEQPFGWEFYVQSNNRAVMQRIVPGLSLNQNKVKEYTGIIARRVKAEEAAPGKFIMYVSSPSN